jgi:hypothetical protein
LDYSWNTFRDLAPIRDSIASVSMSNQPSGSGELAATNVSVDDFLILLNLSGGVGNRLYFVQITVNTLAARTFVYVIGLQISRSPADPAPRVAKFASVKLLRDNQRQCPAKE